MNSTLSGKLCLFCKKLFKIFPLFYHKQNEYKILKIVTEFFYGIGLGIGFYELILEDLEFPWLTRVILGGVISLILGLGNAISIQIRCISLLTIPSLCGRAGRGVLKAIVITLILAGPIENIINNGHEVIRVFTCSTTLTYNLTKTRFKLMFQPFAEAILNIKADVDEVKDTVKSIQTFVNPIAEEIEGEAEMNKIREDNDYIDEIQGDSSREKEMDEKYREDTTEPEQSRYEKRYKRKLASRCEDIISHGTGKCRRMFSEAYDRCYDKVSWMAAWLLCWPMKLTFICNIVEAMGGSKPCDARQVIEPGLGEGYSYLKNSRRTLNEEFQGAKIQYQMPHIPKLLDVRQAADSAQDIINEFQRKKKILETIMTIVKRLIALVFVKVILSAQEYHDKYLSDIQFDNMYITKYFKKIDARRHKKEQHTLLPVKKVERSVLVESCSYFPTTQERKKLVPQTVRLLLEMVTATIFILLDRLLFELLDLVRRHSGMEYVQEGTHDLTLKVKGTGMIANLVRSVLRGFNIRKRVKNIQTNEACLPLPTKLQNYYWYKIYGIYLGIWCLILSEAYTQRFRRLICGFFYPKREKRRILFLYNETLKRRHGLFKFMRAKVKRMVRQQRLELDANFLLVLRIRFPTKCNWLRIFAAARQKCLICEDPEPRKPRKADNFVSCPNPACHFVYCSECWKDIGKICYACSSPDVSDEDDDEENDMY